MLVRAKKLSALLASSRAPRCVRFLECVVNTDMRGLAVNPNVRLIACSVLRQPDASGQVSAMRATVPAILLRRRFAQVFPAVINFVAVYVIDTPGGPFTRLHHKNETMGADIERPYVDCHITPNFPGCLAGVYAIPLALLFGIFEVFRRSRFPRQQAGKRIVRKAFMQIRLGRQIWHRQSFAMGALL